MQTADLTATLLDVLGRDVPDAVAGQPVGVRPADDGHLDRLRDVGAAATGVSVVQGWVSAAVLTALVLLLVVGLAVVRRDPTPQRRMMVAVVGTAAMAAPVAGHLSALLPWWRVGMADLPGERSWWGPGIVLTLAVVGLVAVVLALAWGGPWRRDPLGPVAVIAAVTVVALGVDVIGSDGDHLSLTSVVGVAPLRAGRFYGIGNVAFGILSASGLILAGCLASWLLPRRWWAAGTVVVVGLMTAAIGGVPLWGADFGGIPAMVAATLVLAMAAAGLQLTLVRVLLIGVTAVVVSAAVMVLDWLRGPGARTHLGDFVQSVVDGEASDIVAAQARPERRHAHRLPGVVDRRRAARPHHLGGGRPRLAARPRDGAAVAGAPDAVDGVGAAGVLGGRLGPQRLRHRHRGARSHGGGGGRDQPARQGARRAEPDARPSDRPARRRERRARRTSRYCRARCS